MADEFELKFSVQRETLRILASKVPWLAEAIPQSNQQLNTFYFDTPNRDLKGQGVFLRVRHSGDRLLQSVKKINGIERAEWEHELAKPCPDRKLVGSKSVRSILRKKKVANSLDSIFATKVQRASYIWRDDSTRVEVALDDGEIETQAQRLAIHEIELELKSGDPWELLRLGRELVQHVPATLSFVSKGERGYLLSEGKWGVAKKATTPRVREYMSAQEAVQAICYACMNTFMLNYAMFDGVKADVELVHQMRISIRRLRAAMAFFKSISARKESKSLREELKWISDLLGSARDFDVWQTEKLEPLVTDGHPLQGIAALSNHVEAQRLAARARLEEGLKSARLRILLFNLLVWLKHEEWAVRMREVHEVSIGKYLDRHLSKRLDKIVKAGKDIEKMDAAAQHRLRIEAKKLRYVAEFFEDLAESGQDHKAFKEIVAALEAMQSALGQVHDAVALSSYLADEFATAKPTHERTHDAAFAAGVLASAEPESKSLIKCAAKSHADLSAWRAFWSS